MLEYFELPEMPGRKHFRCEKLRATLAVNACADMWRMANEKNLDRLARCKTCLIGATHAGETAASMSPLLGKTLCARCQRSADRLIQHHLCISCYNRQREWLRGRNAKGTKPSKMAPLDERQIHYYAAGELRRIHLHLSADTTELMAAVLRDCRKRVVFGFVGMPSGITQQRLF